MIPLFCRNYFFERALERLWAFVRFHLTRDIDETLVALGIGQLGFRFVSHSRTYSTTNAAFPLGRA